VGILRLTETHAQEAEQRMNTLDGAGVLADLNGLVYTHGFEALTTAAVVSYYIGDSNLYYSYAGHPPILVQQGSGAWRPRPIENRGRPANLPLGVMRDVRYDQATLALKPGDRIFLYTDGVTECPNPGGDFYGDENLLDVLTETAGLSLPEVKETVFASLLNHAGGELLHDDCTLMVVEVKKARG
jgi:sigma-B regulation protein RsbU (phosphoserine phosphatase)